MVESPSRGCGRGICFLGGGGLLVETENSALLTKLALHPLHLLVKFRAPHLADTQ